MPADIVLASRHRGIATSRTQKGSLGTSYLLRLHAGAQREVAGARAPVCPSLATPLDTVDVLGEIQQNVSAMLGEVVNCMKRADMQDVCYNSSAYSSTVHANSIPFQEFYGCTGTHITGFTITASTSTYWLTSVQFTYVVNGAVVTGQRHGTYTHGTSYGTAYTVTLNPEERIIQIEGRAHSGAYLFQLTFTTNEGRTLGPYGTENGNRFTIDNCEPRGVFGYTFANVVDQIGFYCAETM